jgi:hypothetical protein
MTLPSLFHISERAMGLVCTRAEGADMVVVCGKFKIKPARLKPF